MNSVYYDLDDTNVINGSHPSIRHELPFANNFMSSGSRITLYVSSSKTANRQLAFAKFRIKFKQNKFPISFRIGVKLPYEQRARLQYADITLYFFAYTTNPATHTDTFMPAEISQLLLQGMNRIEQKLDIYVKANGIEITGLFRSRFGQ